MGRNRCEEPYCLARSRNRPIHAQAESAVRQSVGHRNDVSIPTPLSLTWVLVLLSWVNKKPEDLGNLRWPITSRADLRPPQCIRLGCSSAALQLNAIKAMQPAGANAAQWLVCLPKLSVQNIYKKTEAAVHPLLRWSYNL